MGFTFSLNLNYFLFHNDFQSNFSQNLTDFIFFISYQVKSLFHLTDTRFYSFFLTKNRFHQFFFIIESFYCLLLVHLLKNRFVISDDAFYFLMLCQNSVHSSCEGMEISYHFINLFMKSYVKFKKVLICIICKHFYFPIEFIFIQKLNHSFECKIKGLHFFSQKLENFIHLNQLALKCHLKN